MQRFTTEGLRHHNRALVLRRLREVGEITHGDLAGATGLAAGTVSVILNELVEERIVERRQAERASGRGRPKIKFAVIGETTHAVIARISSSAVEFSLINFVGALKDRFSLQRDQQDETVLSFIRLIRLGLSRISERSGINLTRMGAVTLTTKGVVFDGEQRLVWTPSFGQEVIDFGRTFNDLKDRLRIVQEPSLIADYLFDGRRTLACLSVGGTVSLGVTRQLDSGTTEQTAPNFGHFCHEPNGPHCSCGSQGCIEAYASFHGVLHTAFEAPPRRGSFQAIPREEILRLAEGARNGNTDFLIAFHQAGEALGLGLSRMASIYGSMEIVMTGAGVEYFDLMQPMIRKHLNANNMHRFGHDITLQLRADEASLGFEAACQFSLQQIDESLVAPRRLVSRAAS